MKPGQSLIYTDDQRQRMCESKQRWPDSLSAAAGALCALEARPDEVQKLWTYRCPICRGWHLTRNKQDGVPPITLGNSREEA